MTDQYFILKPQRPFKAIQFVLQNDGMKINQLGHDKVKINQAMGMIYCLTVQTPSGEKTCGQFDWVAFHDDGTLDVITKGEMNSHYDPAGV